MLPRAPGDHHGNENSISTTLPRLSIITSRRSNGPSKHETGKRGLKRGYCTLPYNSTFRLCTAAVATSAIRSSLADPDLLSDELARAPGPVTDTLCPPFASLWFSLPGVVGSPGLALKPVGDGSGDKSVFNLFMATGDCGEARENWDVSFFSVLSACTLMWDLMFVFTIFLICSSRDSICVRSTRSGLAVPHV